MYYAYSKGNKLISANEAFKQGSYVCPICRGRLRFIPGKVIKSHFRHSKGVPEEIKKACELYSFSNTSFNHLKQEELANQQIRLVISPSKNSYTIYLRFPRIKEKNISRVIYDDLYFNYYCDEIEDFVMNNKNLMYSNSESLIEVPIKQSYTFECDNPKYESILNLNISGKYEPFLSGSILFKNIQGEYRSVSYRQLTLSGRFFILSKTPLIDIPNTIEVISISKVNQVYLYDLVMPEKLDDNLLDWFNRELKYTILPATSFLDLITPTRFKKIGSTFEVLTESCDFLYTAKGIQKTNPIICILDPSGSLSRIQLDSSGNFSLDLDFTGDYTLIVESGVSEIYTIRKIEKIENNIPNSKHFTIDDENILLSTNKISCDSVGLSTNLTFELYNSTEIGFTYQKGGDYNFEAPTILSLPKLWKVELQCVDKDESPNIIKWDVILKVFIFSKKYPQKKYCNKQLKALEMKLKESNFQHKQILLNFIRKQKTYIPEPILNELEKLR